MTPAATHHDTGFTTFIELLMTPLQRRKRRELLDLRDLPDHLKRDIGILDGHEAPGRLR